MAVSELISFLSRQRLETPFVISSPLCIVYTHNSLWYAGGQLRRCSSSVWPMSMNNRRHLLPNVYNENRPGRC